MQLVPGPRGAASSGFAGSRQREQALAGFGTAPVHALGIARESYLHVAGSANDVIGAKSAGVACYWNNRTGDRVLLPEFAADAEGPDLRGVLDLVRGGRVAYPACEEASGRSKASREAAP